MISNTDARFRQRYAAALAATVSLLAVAAPGVALAQTVDKVKSGDWSTPDNWNLQRPPRSDETALLLTDTSISDGQKVVAKIFVQADLTISNGSGLTVADPGSGFNPLPIMLISEGGKLTMDSSGGVITVGHSLRIGECTSGKLELTGGTIVVGPSGPVAGNEGLLSVGSSLGAVCNDGVEASELIVTGPESIVNARQLGVGVGTIDINGGGGAFVGNFSVGPVGKVTIGDAGSFLSATGLTLVQGELLVQNGGQITTKSLLLRNDESSPMLAIDGAGSSVGVTAGIVVGGNRLAANANLSLTRGGRVSANSAEIRLGGIVSIKGEGSLLTLNDTSDPRVDYGLLVSGGGELIIAEAGKAAVVRDGYIRGGLLTVGGASILPSDILLPDVEDAAIVFGGLLEIAYGDLGGDRIDGRMVIRNGGEVVSAGATLAGGIVVIDGGGSIWRAGDRLDVNGSPKTEGSAGSGGIRGSGAVTLRSGGTLTAGTINLGTNDNENREGSINIGAGAMDIRAAPGILTIEDKIVIGPTGRIVFNHEGVDFSFQPVVDSLAPGDGTILQMNGTTILASDLRRFSGVAHVTGGTLVVNTEMRPALIDVGPAGTLAGSGVIAGTVTVASGGRLVGVQGQTLTMDTLNLGANAILDVTLGAPDATPLFAIGGIASLGTLVLDGTVDVRSNGALGVGLYRLFDYSGGFTDNGLDIGLTPDGVTAGNFTVVTSIAGQVNLISGSGGGGGAGDSFFFWDPGTSGDGSIEGGSGVWSVAAANWSNATGMAKPLVQPGFMIFSGNAGTVIVDGSAEPINVDGIQFASGGYSIAGDAIALNLEATPIRVGDGSIDGAGFAATIAAPLIGPGGFEKTDLGTLTLTGVNSYTGTTTITDGTLAGSAASFGAGAILNNATFVIDQNDAADFANRIDGAGLFVKRGSGALNLTGTSGFSGNTLVEAGRLAVNGALASSIITVRSGATLGGTGQVGGIVAQSGAIIAPGNSIGTLNVTGDYVAAAGSIYQVELDGTGAADRIVATGSATIAPGATLQLIKVGPAPFVAGTRYTFLTAAGGVSGTYALTGDTAISAFFGLTVNYDAEQSYLEVARIRSFASAGVTSNQVAVGTGVESLGAGNPLFEAIAGLAMADAAPGIFDRLSGEIHASVKTAALEDSRFVRAAVIDRLRDSFNPETTTAGWGRAFGSWGHHDASTTTGEVDRSTGGLIMGVDVGGGDHWRFGVAGGLGRSRLNLDARASRATSNDYHLGVYGGGQWGGFSLRAGAAYNLRDLDVRRSVAFNDFNDSLSTSYKMGVAQIFGEIGYRINAGAVAIEPFAGLAYVNVDTDAGSESGGSTALSVRDGQADAVFSTLGLRASAALGRSDGMGTSLHGSVAWRRTHGDLVPVAALAFGGGNDFSISGAELDRNSIAIDAGLDFALADDIRAGFSYTGQIGDGLSDHGVKGTLSWIF